MDITDFGHRSSSLRNISIEAGKCNWFCLQVLSENPYSAMQFSPSCWGLNQIKSLLLSHHHNTSALVSEILMSVLQTVQKNNRQFTYGQTVQKNNKQFTYGQTVQKNNRQFTYGQTVQKKLQTIYIWTDSAKKLHWSIYSAPDSAKKKKKTAIYIWTDSAKKTTAIYIWTVHIYRLYRRQCAKYTYMYSVRLVYYKDILNYQRHIIHSMGTSTLCTVSIHNVVYT